MRTHLIFTPYFDKNPERRIELNRCYFQNFQVGFDYITIIVENKDFEYVQKIVSDLISHSDHGYVRLVRTEERPRFQDYISYSNEISEINPDIIHMVCNSDIYIETEDLEKIKSLPWDQKLFVALSRWDHGKEEGLILLDRWDSQDTWFWKGHCDVTTAQCPIGWPGSDNSIAHKFKEVGYKVINPSRDIQTKHLHLVQGNNYRVGANPNAPVIADMVCKEPYHLITPHTINEI